MTRRHKTILQIDGVDEDSKYEGTGSEMDDISDDDNERSVEMDEEDEDDDESDDDSERNVKVVEMDEEDEDDDEYEAERVPVLIEDRDAEKIPVLIDDGCHTSGVVIDEGNDLIKHVNEEDESDDGDRREKVNGLDDVGMTMHNDRNVEDRGPDEDDALIKHVNNVDEEVSHEAEKVPGLIEVRDAEDDKHVNRCKLCPPGTKEYCESLDFEKHLVLEHYSGKLLKYIPFMKGQACRNCGFTSDRIETYVHHVGIWHGKILDLLPEDTLAMLLRLTKEEDTVNAVSYVIGKKMKEKHSKKKEDDLGYGLFD